MARYRVGEGPLDKLWFVIDMAKGAKIYVQAVLALSDELDKAMYAPVRPPKPKPLHVQSERAPLRDDDYTPESVNRDAGL